VATQIVCILQRLDDVHAEPVIRKQDITQPQNKS
jgi:hypothetical protein